MKRILPILVLLLLPSICWAFNPLNPFGGFQPWQMANATRDSVVAVQEDSVYSLRADFADSSSSLWIDGASLLGASGNAPTDTTINQGTITGKSYAAGDTAFYNWILKTNFSSITSIDVYIWQNDAGQDSLVLRAGMKGMAVGEQSQSWGTAQTIRYKFAATANILILQSFSSAFTGLTANDMAQFYLTRIAADSGDPTINPVILGVRVKGVGL
jgi:hypothetical protein